MLLRYIFPVPILLASIGFTSAGLIPDYVWFGSCHEDLPVKENFSLDQVRQHSFETLLKYDVSVSNFIMYAP